MGQLSRATAMYGSADCIHALAASRRPPAHFQLSSLPPAPALPQAGDRATKKAQRAAARGVMRKSLKLLAGPLLEGSPALLPRALPLLLAALLVGPACGPKVAATAAKAARKLEHPLLAAVHGLALPREGEEDAEQGAGEAPKSAKKGGKKGGKAGAKEAAAEPSKAAADAAYNSRLVAALGSEAAGSPAAAAALTQLLVEAAGDGAAPGIARAEPLLLMAAHAAMQRGGPGAAALSLALVQQLQAQPVPPAVAAAAAADVLPSECFDESGVATGPLLERVVAGSLTAAGLRSAALLAALRAVPWADLAPRGGKVRGVGLAALWWRE